MYNGILYQLLCFLYQIGVFVSCSCPLIVSPLYSNLCYFMYLQMKWSTVPQDGKSRVRFLVGSLEIFQVTYSLCPYSVALGFTQCLTEMSAKEFPWGLLRGRDIYNWQFCCPSCAECQSTDGSPTFHSPSQSPWLVMGKLYLYLWHLPSLEEI